MSLLSMAITDRGVPSASFTGSQAGILTDTAHGRAKILEVRADRLRETGYQVWTTPFGYFCEWDLSVHGESLAKVWKEIH